MGSYNYYKVFGFNRKFKITESGPPPDVIDAFTLCSKRGYHLSPPQLHRFLTEFQGERDSTISDAENMMEKILLQRHHLDHFTPYSFNLEDFFQFLFLEDLNGPIKSQVHHDMTAPLQDYFIYTGHNSYLTGNQLSSDSSEVPIIKALQRGVRAIELDLWPNSARDGIHVLHGRTLCTPVPLLKCLKSIKQHAFVRSPYPVIITLEDHLTKSLQAKAAQMVVQTFGNMLYYPESELQEEFPSPEALKYRVIISTKPPNLDDSKLSLKESVTSLEKDSSEEELSLGEETSDITADGRSNSDLEDDEEDTANSTQSLAKLLGVAYEDALFDNQKDNESQKDTDYLKDFDSSRDADNQKPSQPVQPEYKRLIAIRASKPKNGVKRSLANESVKARRLSLSEQALEKAAASYGTDIVRFTQKNILRVYPKGTRVTSSNFRPFTAWIHGAQMVACNMQGYGKSLWMMHGMFRANGGCGYVKKPDLLIEQGPLGEVFDPKATLPVKKTLKVKVYMGDGWRLDFSHTHFDAYSPPDFYTKLFIVGVPADVAKKKTRIVGDDWTPIWDEEFSFPLTVPELALLKIVVCEYDVSEKDDFGGQTCLPVAELRTGIRVVPLHNKKGEKFKSVKLLMRFLLV